LKKNHPRSFWLRKRNDAESGKNAAQFIRFLLTGPIPWLAMPLIAAPMSDLAPKLFLDLQKFSGLRESDSFL
jgi:hypothetical protein